MMTNTNEPQDPLNATQNESEGTGSQNQNEVPKVSSPGNEADKNNWSEGLDSESVEEAFLALIQSNKAQDEPEEMSSPLASSSPGVAPEINSFQEPVIKPTEMQTPTAQDVEDETSAFLSMTQNALDETVKAAEASSDSQLKPFEPDMEESGLHERLAEEIFSDLTSEQIPDVAANDGQSITDALSEKIAGSLAELQSGQAAPTSPVSEPVALDNNNEVSPQQQLDDLLSNLPQNPPVTQEFAPAVPEKPQEIPQQQNQAANPPAQGMTPQVMPYSALEQSIARTTNNDVTGQQHTPPVSYENQTTNTAQNLQQVQGKQFANEFQAAGPSAPVEQPATVNLASQNRAPKTNVDPEFQALVQWSNSDVEPSHHGPNDIPNFLSQKREEENKFSFKTVFISIGISVVVISMFWMGYQAGRVKTPNGSDDVIDMTAAERQNKEIVVETRRNEPVAQNSFNNEERPARQVQVRQQRPAVKPKISVFSVKNLSGTSGKPIPMNIRLEGDNLGRKTMLLFRGIPDEITLSKGLKREGLWSVPIADLRKLALVVPNNYKGRFDFEVFAFKDKESSPERRLASVRILASQPAAASISNVGTAPQNRDVESQRERVNNFPNQSNQPQFNNQQNTQPRQRVAVLPPENRPQNFGNNIQQQPVKRVQPVRTRKVERTSTVSPSVERSMLKRGGELLSNGDVSGARLVYEHVAIQGSKHAAFALAKTYDEEFIAQLAQGGIVPEMELAIKWYKKAAALGHKEAERRLAKLGLR